MIVKIQGKYFKNIPEFDQPLGRLNLICGPNGSGKSARTDALQLLLMGHILGVGKKNQDIHAACSAPDNDKIFVGCTIADANGKPTKFLKRYAKDPETGSVSLVYHVRDTKASATAYASALGSCGAPKIVDPDVFMGLSGPKQISELFSLFPPDGDLASLNMRIAEAKERVNAKINAKAEQDQLTATLTQSVARFELGTGTLADLEVEEKTIADALDAAKTDLINEKAKSEAERMIEKANADHAEAIQKLTEQAATEAAANQAESDEKYQELLRKGKEAQDKANTGLAAERAKREQKDSSTSELPVHTSDPPEVKAAVDRLTQNARRTGALPALQAALSGAKNPLLQQHVAKMEEIKQSGAVITAVEKIISAMERAGCTMCAAMLVARRETRALKGGAQ